MNTGNNNNEEVNKDIINISIDQEQVLTENKTTDSTDPIKTATSKQSTSSNTGSGLFNLGTPPKTGDIPPVRKDGLFDNIGKRVQGNTQSGGERDLSIDLSEYQDYFGGNLGYIPDVATLDKYRAHRQTGLQQAGNALARVGLNIIPEIIGQAANVLDLEDYVQADQEVGNWLSNWTKELQEKTNKNFEIYEENPGEALAFTDSAWWFKNGASLATSAGAFVALGYATGGAAAFAASGTARLVGGSNALRSLSNGKKSLQFLESLAAANTGTKGVRAISTLSSSIMLNQAEGIGVAVETFDEAYNKKKQELQGGEQGLILSDEEIDIQAKQYAADAAASALNFNRINIALNLTSAAALLRTPVSTRALLNKKTWLSELKDVGGEMLQESAEESINMLSKEQALDENYTVAKALSAIGSNEGIESALLGAIGGGFQTGLSKASSNIAMRENTVYKQAYASRLNELQSNTGLTKAQKEKEAEDFAVKKAGTNKKRVSDNYIHNRRYFEQQEELAKNVERSKEAKIADVTNVYMNLEESAKLLRELEIAQNNNNTKEVEAIQNKLLYQQATNAFNTGTTDSLLELYKGHQNLSAAKAVQQGLAVDESDMSYKEKAAKAVETIEALEKDFINAQAYINADEIYTNRINYRYQKDLIDPLTKLVYDKVDEAAQTYLMDPAVVPRKMLITPDGKIDLRTATDAFKATPEYEYIKDIKEQIDVFRKNVEDAQEQYKTLTSKDTQSKLKEAYKEYRESIKKAKKRTERKEKASKVKQKAKDIVSKLKKTSTDPDTTTNTTSTVNEANTTSTTSNVDTTTTVQDANTNNTVSDVNTSSITTADEEAIPEAIPTASITPVAPALATPIIDRSTYKAPLTGNFEIDSLVLKTFNANIGNQEVPKQGILNLIANAKQVALNAIEGKPVDAKVTAFLEELDKLENSVKREMSAQEAITLEQDIDNAIDDLANDILNEADTVDADAESIEALDAEARIRQIEKLLALYNKLTLAGKSTDFPNVVKEFVRVVGMEKTAKLYDDLTSINQLAGQGKIVESFESIIYSDKDKQQIVETDKTMQKKMLSSEVYTSEMNSTIDKNIAATVSDIIDNDATYDKQVNFDYDTDAGARHETGNNKVAYLAQDWTRVFQAKMINGELRITVSKRDATNFINKIDDKLLDSSLIKPGDTLGFVLIDEVILADGTTVTAKGGVENAPIGITHNGELIEGAYLHRPEWITEESVAVSPLVESAIDAKGKPYQKIVKTKKQLLEEDRAALRELRQAVIDGKNVQAIVSARTSGHLIRTTSGTVSSNLPNAQIGIVKNGRVFISGDRTVDTNNTVSIEDGKAVVLIPFVNKKGNITAMPVKRSPLKPEYVTSISEAIRLFLTGENTSVVKELKDKHGIDILNMSGLKDYLGTFIHTYESLDNNPDGTNAFQSLLESVDDNIALLRLTGNGIEFGRGAGINFNVVNADKFKGKTKGIDTVITNLEKVLQLMYVNVSANKLGQNKPVVTIGPDGVKVAAETYQEHVKNNTYTDFTSVKTSTGKEVYSVQGTISFDTIVNASNNTITQTATSNQSKTEITESIDPTAFDPNDIDDVFAINEEPNNNINYTLKGKETQSYTIEGDKIFNSKGKEVFKTDSKDRRRIFANYEIQNKTAVIVKIRGQQYVVNNADVITSVKTGDIVFTDNNNGVGKEIRQAAQNKRKTITKADTVVNFVNKDVSHPIFKATTKNIDYTQGQVNALNQVAQFLTTSDSFFLLAGYAGTGKTTIAENIQAYANAYVMAPTNTAVERLRNKFSNNSNADKFATIHKAVYGAPDPLTGEFQNPDMPENAVVIIDEASMIDEKVFNDVIELAKKNNTKLIFLGDSFQLEPVGKNPNIFDKFNFGNNRTELTEVKRTDNSILAVATHMRTVKKPDILNVNNDEFSVVNSYAQEIKEDIANGENFVLLTTTNNTRIDANTWIRKEKYKELSNNVINDGEQLIGIANVSNMNGQQFTIKEPEIENEGTFKENDKTYKYVLIRYKKNNDKQNDKTGLVLLLPDYDKAAYNVQEAMNNEAFKDYPFIAESPNEKTVWGGADIATYGYAMTVHKSQGNEWNNVYISIPYMASSWDAGRLIYTAITRGKNKVRLKTNNSITINKEIDPNTVLATQSVIQPASLLINTNSSEKDVKGVKNSVVAEQLDLFGEESNNNNITTKVDTSMSFSTLTKIPVYSNQGVNVMRKAGQVATEAQIASTLPNQVNYSSNVAYKETFIPGVNLSIQRHLIENTVEKIYGAAVAGDKSSFMQILDAQFKKLVETRKTWVNNTNPKSATYIDQIDKILEGREFIEKAVKNKLSNIIGVKKGFVAGQDLQEEADIEEVKDPTQYTDDELDTAYKNAINDKESVLEKQDYNDSSIYKVNPMSTLSLKLKNFLANTIDLKIAKDVNGNDIYKPKYSFLGTEFTMPFTVVYNDLSAMLASTNNQYIEPTFEAYIAALEKYQKGKPYLYSVVQKLKAADEDMQTAFVSNFAKHYTHHMFLNMVYTKNGIDFRPSYSDSRNIVSNIQVEWKNNLYFQELRELDAATGNYILKQGVKDAFVNYFTVLKDAVKLGSVPSDTQLKKWLKQVGIDVSEFTINEIMTEASSENGFYYKGGRYNTTTLFTSKGSPFSIIVDEVAKNTDLERNNYLDQQAVRALANIERFYRTDLYTNSHKNINGDSIYPYSFNKFLIDRFVDLKNNPKLLDELLQDPFSANSEWLQELVTKQADGTYLRDKKGNLVINRDSRFFEAFEYATVDGYKVGAQKGSELTNASPKEIETFKLGLYMNKGGGSKKAGSKHIMRVMYPTLSDKSSSYLFKTTFDMIKLTESGDILETDLARLFNTLVQPEIDRIKAFNAKRKNDIAEGKTSINIKEYSQGAGMFLLFPELNEVEGIWLENEDGTKDLLPTIGTSIKDTAALKTAFKNNLKSLRQDTVKRLEQLQLLDSSREGLSQIRVVDKGYAARYEGQTIQEFTLNYMLAELQSNMNFQQLFIGDPALFYKKGNTAVLAGLATSDNQGKRLAGDNAARKNIIHKSGETMSVLVVADIEAGNKSLQYDYYEKLLGEEKAKAYLNINGADAQEYVSLAEHLQILNRLGELSTTDMNRMLDMHEQGLPLESEDINIILQPMKPVYVNSFLRDGVMSKFYIKSSAVPLIKQYTKGTDLDKLRLLLEETVEQPDGTTKRKIDRIAFSSAVKVGSPINAAPIWNEGKIVIPKDLSSHIVTAPRKGHGIQQDTPYQPDKDTINDGTQQRKLLFSNLLNVGGFTDPNTGESITGRQLYDQYNSYYKQLFDLKYEQLVVDLDFDASTNSIDFNKLQALIEKEAIKREFIENDIIALEKNKTGTNFRVPLFLTGNESKIGSLLNSIVNNRIIKIKPKGRSNILVSEEGFTLTNIVTIPGFDRTKGLQPMREDENGNILPAEIVIPFYFNDHNGKRLKMSDYVVDGVLNTELFDEQLLEQFGFRIPTQGLNSMAYMKVVGFMPEGYEDTIVAPRDFVVQMGSDFDVDKLYANMYNSIYNVNTKRIELLTQSKALQVIDNLTRLDELQEQWAESKELPQEKGNAIRATIKKEQAEIAKNNWQYTDKKSIQEQLLENEILKVHAAVMLNPAKEVQAQRAKPLDFGDLSDLAKKYYNSVLDYSFSPLYGGYQTYKYLNARASKAGMGVFSLDSVLNATLQTVGAPIKFTKLVPTETGFRKALIDYNIFGIPSVNLETQKGYTGKYKSDVIAAFQSVAADNEKEQLLHKLNINNYTFDFIRAMAQLGYNEEIIITVLLQPAIKDYIAQKEIDSEYEIEQEFDGREKAISAIKLKDLQANLTSTKLDIEAIADQQQNVLALFLEMTNNGRELKAVQSAINSDSAGIGKDMFYTLEKADQLLLLGKRNISNITKIIGDYINYTFTPEYLEAREQGKAALTAYHKQMVDSGAVRFGNVYIRPSTIAGYASVRGTLFNLQIWKDYLPYQSGNIGGIIKTVLNNSNLKGATLSERAAASKSIYSAYKSFIFSGALADITGRDLKSLRKELLYDIPEKNVSLARYLGEIKNLLPNRFFINKLEIGDTNGDLNEIGAFPNAIRYNAAAADSMEENYVREDIIQLLESRQELPSLNGESMDSRKLMEKLIYHQFLTGGVQKANEFIKHIPVEILESMGIFKAAYNNVFGTDVKKGKLATAFLNQYIQHNPKKFYIEPNKRNPEKEYLFEIEEAEGTLKGYSIKLKNPTTKQFVEVDALGTGTHLEYDYSNEIGKSMIYMNQTAENNAITDSENDEMVVPTYKVTIPNAGQVRDFVKFDSASNIGQVLQEKKDLVTKYNLDSDSLSIEEQYKAILTKIAANSTDPVTGYFANELKNLTSVLANVPIHINTNLSNKARLQRIKIVNTPLRIEINPNKITGEADLERVLIEEITHAIFSEKENSKRFEPLYNEIKQKMLLMYNDEYTAFEQRVAEGKGAANSFQRDILYPLTSLDEFIGALTSNKAFRDTLETLNTDSKTSFIDRIKNLIKDILVKLGIKADTYLEDAIAIMLETTEAIARRDRMPVKQFVRTKDFVSQKLGLSTIDGKLIPVANAQEAAAFVNKYFSNLQAFVDKDTSTVVIEPRKSEIEKLFAIDADGLEQSIDDNLGLEKDYPDYKASLTIRMKTLRKALTRAKAENNTNRIERIEKAIILTEEKIASADAVYSLKEMYDKGIQDIDELQELLDGEMTTEDMLYARRTVEFWANAREILFSDDEYTSKSLNEAFGNLEGQAANIDKQLLNIEKAFIQKLVKLHTGQDKTIDDIMDNYSDVNWISSRTRDISTSDNLILDAIWLSVKKANIASRNELEKTLGDYNSLVEKILPKLNKTGKGDAYEVFRQLSPNGKYTGHMVSRISMHYYNRRKKNSNLGYKSEYADLLKYRQFLAGNVEDVDLAALFPLESNGENKARTELKARLGEKHYLEYITKQQSKITKYEEAYEGKLRAVMSKYSISNKEEVKNNQKASEELTYWKHLHSPFKLNKWAQEGLPVYITNYKGFRNNDFYEEIPALTDERNYDKNFATIENDEDLLAFYNKSTEIMTELKQYLPDSIKRKLSLNGLPAIEKTLIENFKEKGMKVGLVGIYDAWTKSTTSNHGDNAKGIIDPATKKIDRDLQVQGLQDTEQEFKRQMALKTQEYLLENPDAVISEGTREAWVEEIKHNLAQTKSFDVARVVKMFAALTLSYKHKSRIEDQINIANNIVSGYRENKTDSTGKKIKDANKPGAFLQETEDASFKNMKAQIDYYMDVFYGTARAEEGLGKKVLTATEKQTKADIEELLLKNNAQLEAGKIDEETHKFHKDSLESMIKALGKRRVTSKIGDNFLKYFQLKGMGWNVLAGIANVGFGFISNIIEGAGNQYYSNKDLMDAYKLTINSVGRNITFNKGNFPEGAKIRALMDKWDVMKDASQELFSSSVPNSYTNKLRWLNPYNVNQRTEFLNQAPLLIALTKNQIIVTPKGDIKAWEGYDVDGNWKTDEYGPEPVEAITNLRIKLDQLIKRNHGNYDPESPILAKKTFVGRALSQFRSWMYEGYAVRFEAERADSALGKVVKGRYRSVVSLYQQADALTSTMALLKSIARQGSFNTLFKNADFNNMVGENGISEIDAANLRRASMEMLLFINLNLAMTIIMLMVGDLDDDDPKKYAYNLMINNGLRLKTDIAFYVNPVEARKLIKDPIPAISIVKDVFNWIDSIGKLVIGQDEYEAGVFQGDSRSLKATSVMFPLTSQLYRAYNSGEQIFDKN